MRSLWAYARHWIFQIYLWAVLNEAIPGESTGLYTPAEGVRLGAKMFHFNRGGSSTKAELNSMSLVSTPPLPWQRLFPPAIIIHNLILSSLLFWFTIVGMITSGKRWFFFHRLFGYPGYERLSVHFQTDMNGLNVLQKRLHLSYKHPANNFLRGLNRTVENLFLGGFSRGEYGYDLLEISLAKRETVPLIAHLDFSKSPFQ